MTQPGCWSIAAPPVHPRTRPSPELSQLLRPDDLVVLNETRVLPARVAIRRDTGGAGEVLLLEPIDAAVLEAAGADDEDPEWWEALCRPSRKLAVGQIVRAEVGELEFEIGEELGDGRRLVRPIHDGELLAALDDAGVAPLPPYIHERLGDQERYQTVFSRRPASAAAPTAGLHLTAAVLDGLRGRRRPGRDGGAGRRARHLPADQRRPRRGPRHPLASSTRCRSTTWDAVEPAISDGRRVVAVGTTTVRALESAATLGRLGGRTRLFITPGYRFKVVDVMMTNFHLPRSSLLAMVEAFVGPRWRELYAHRGRAGVPLPVASATPCCSTAAAGGAGRREARASRSTATDGAARARASCAPPGARSARRCSCRSAPAAPSAR